MKNLFMILILFTASYNIAYGGRGAEVQGLNFVTNYQNVTFGKSDGYNYSPTVMFDDDGLYKMWWTSNAPDNDCEEGWDDTIWYAISIDGVNWSNQGVAVTAIPPYHLLVADPSVVKINGIYYMYYTATSDLTNNGADNEIFVSTSVDAITWTPVLQAVIPLPNPDDFSYGIGQPTVVYRDDLGIVQMWFTWTNGPSGYGVYYSESTDPLFPNPTTPELVIAGFNGPDIKYISEFNKYLMIFEYYYEPDGQNYLLYNLSNDGIQWQQSSFDLNAHVEMATSNTSPGQAGIVGNSKGWMIDDSFVIANNNAPYDPGCDWQLEISSLDIYQIPPNAVYRFRNPIHNDRYYSITPTSPNEFYTYEGMGFILYNYNEPNTDYLYQLYNSSTIKHLYTSNWDEVLYANGLGFNYEGYLGYIGLSYIEGSTILYRLRQSSTYLYTTSIYEKELAKLYYNYVEENSPGFVMPPLSQYGRPSSICSFSISPTSKSFTYQSGVGSIYVTSSSSNCPWVAFTNSSWINITNGSTGTGNGTVSYSVFANSGPARNGTITIAGETFAISQSSGCTYSINPTSRTIDYLGDTGSVAVTAGSGCGWISSSNDSWIHITNGLDGSGNGTVEYSVDSNPGSGRSGTATIAGQTFTINQGDASCYSYCQTQYVNDCVNGFYAQCFTSCGGIPGCITSCMMYMEPQISAVCNPNYCTENVCQ